MVMLVNNQKILLHLLIFLFYNTNPSTSSASSIYRITDKNFNPIENEFFLGNKIIIPVNNTISGIIKQTAQDNIMIKTKYGFISAITFYFDNGSSSHPHTTGPINNFAVTASSGDLKNAVQVTIEYDNDGTGWSNGVKFARRIRVYGYK
jgi:energy-converting hydrogenase Eha subunit B